MPSSRTVGSTSASASRLHSDSSVWTAVIGAIACARRIVSRRRFATGRGSGSSPPPSAAPSRRPYPRSARWGRRGADNRDRSSRRRAASGSPRRPSGHIRGRRVTPRNSPFGPRTLPNLVARNTWSRRSRIARPTSSSFLPDAVHVGGVEEGDAAIERVVDGRDRFLLAAAAVELAHAHAAEADGGNFGAVARVAGEHEHGLRLFEAHRTLLLIMEFDRLLRLAFQVDRHF